MIGRHDDPIYREFLGLFMARLGGSPLWVTLLASAGFYAYAGLRRVSAAPDALTIALIALALVNPDALVPSGPIALRPEPILAIALLQLALGIDRRDAGRCLVGTAALAVVVALTLPEEVGPTAFRTWLAFQLALGGVLLIGAAFDDPLARFLRLVGAVLVLPACLVALLGPPAPPSGLPPWAGAVYTLVMAGLLVGYGLRLGHRLSLGVAGLLLTCWLVGAAWWAYRFLRQLIVGLDYIALSLTLFAFAVLVSLAKAGALSRRTGRPTNP
jgi:hypothetical protein